MVWIGAGFDPRTVVGVICDLLCDVVSPFAEYVAAEPHGQHDADQYHRRKFTAGHSSGIRISPARPVQSS